MKPAYVRTIIQLALGEDIGKGDITTKHLVPADARGKARLIAKDDGTLCGIDLAHQVFKILDPKVVFRACVAEGQAVRPGMVIAEISGRTRALLSGERVAVNLLSFLSGIATLTHLFVDRIKPYKAKIMDTRKTTPLLRQLERYAVRVGGGVNHRFNLHDMVMIKDNHRAFCQDRNMAGIIQAVKRKTRAKIELEVENMEQLREAFRSKADIILLDNMTSAQVARAVRLRKQAKSSVLLEASGGITLKNVRQYAATGVDRISVGALTHSRRVLDISMEFMP